MNRSRVMQVLIGVRQRRCDALDDAVRTAQQGEQAAQAQAQAAQQALVDAFTAEAAERDKLLGLTDAGQVFDVQLLLLRGHMVQAKKDAVVQQQSEVEQRDAALAQRRLDLRQRRDLRARNQQKIASLQDDLKAWRAAQEQAQDDQQDEEAEEAAIARMFQPAEDPAQAGQGR